MPQAYQSWILRYVPDPVRGEFVNVGVIVGTDGADWAMRKVSNFTRASRLGGQAQRLNPVLREFERRIAATLSVLDGTTGTLDGAPLVPAFSRDAIGEMAARMNNALQISDALPAYGESASAVAEMMFGHLVAQSARQVSHRPRTRMIRGFQDALSSAWQFEQDLPLLRNSRVEIGRQQQSFDFALHDEAIEQLTQVISLNRKNSELVQQEINAWNFAVRLIRDNGAKVPTKLSRQGLYRVEADIPITLVHDVPTTDQARDILATSIEAWNNLDVVSVTPERLTVAAEDALRLVS